MQSNPIRKSGNRVFRGVTLAALALAFTMALTPPAAALGVRIDDNGFFSWFMALFGVESSALTGDDGDGRGTIDPNG